MELHETNLLAGIPPRRKARLLQNHHPQWPTPFLRQVTFDLVLRVVVK